MFPVYDKVLAGLLALATVENERIMLKGSCIELRWAARERFGLRMCWRESLVVWLPAFRVLSCVLCALLPRPWPRPQSPAHSQQREMPQTPKLIFSAPELLQSAPRYKTPCTAKAPKVWAWT